MKKVSGEEEILNKARNKLLSLDELGYIKAGKRRTKQMKQ